VKNRHAIDDGHPPEQEAFSFLRVKVEVSFVLCIESQERNPIAGEQVSAGIRSHLHPIAVVGAGVEAPTRLWGWLFVFALRNVRVHARRPFRLGGPAVLSQRRRLQLRFSYPTAATREQAGPRHRQWRATLTDDAHKLAIVQESGLDPALGAILPLVGVVVGASLAGAVRYLLDQRAEQSRFRAAVWMLVDDLGRLRDILDVQAGTPGPLGVPQSSLHADPALRGWLRVELWSSQREVLARGLLAHEDVWNQIRWTMMSADILFRLYDAGPGGGGEAIMRRQATHDELASRVSATLTALEPFRQAG
jgi:hypothetical protein